MGTNLGRLFKNRFLTTVLLVALLALTTWNVQFDAPAPGLDSSWHAGLFMAVDQGLDFGTDVVFTYGPLGFLAAGNATVWFDGLAIGSFIYASALYLAFCLALIWALRRSMGALPAIVVAFLAIGLLPGIEQALVVSVACAMAVLVPDRNRFALTGLVVAGALFAALETLIKLSVGPPIVMIIAIGLIGARAGWGKVLLFGLLFLVDTLILWVLTGQDLSALPEFISASREVISGYSEAMGFAGVPSWHLLGGAMMVLAVTGAAAFASHRDRLARWSAVAVVAVAGFAIFKEGVVRSDFNHVTILFSTMMAVFLVLPFARTRWPMFVAGATMLMVVAQVIIPGYFSPRLDPIAGARVAVDQAKILFTPSRREAMSEFARANLKQTYSVDERTLAQLDGQTVAIDPWEIGIAWTYDLDWSPLPVFQGYQAYNEELDRINAEEIASADGPSRILRINAAEVVADHPTGDIDGRYAAWDPPAQALATLCHFAPLRTTNRYEVLGRTEDRCAEPEPIGTIDAASGDIVQVPRPDPGSVVFARIEGVGVEGIEKLRTLLFRAQFRYAILDGGRVVRLVPGTATDGLLVRGAPRLTGHAPFAQAPQARTISIEGAGDDLQYQFFQMQVAPSP